MIVEPVTSCHAPIFSQFQSALPAGFFVGILRAIFEITEVCWRDFRRTRIIDTFGNEK